MTLFLRSLFIAGLGLGIAALGSAPAQAGNGDYCREYTRQITIGNQVQMAYGTACQRPDGWWEVVSESAPLPAATPPSQVTYVMPQTTPYYYTPEPRIYYNRQPSVSYNIVYRDSPRYKHSRHYNRYDRHDNHDRGRGHDRNRGRDRH